MSILLFVLFQIVMAICWIYIGFMWSRTIVLKKQIELLKQLDVSEEQYKGKMFILEQIRSVTAKPIGSLFHGKKQNK